MALASIAAFAVDNDSVAAMVSPAASRFLGSLAGIRIAPSGSSHHSWRLAPRRRSALPDAEATAQLIGCHAPASMVATRVAVDGCAYSGDLVELRLDEPHRLQVGISRNWVRPSSDRVARRPTSRKQAVIGSLARWMHWRWSTAVGVLGFRRPSQRFPLVDAIAATALS